YTDNTGEMTAIYAYIDADLDGVPGTAGLFYSMSSASNFNAAVSTDTNDTIPNNGVEINGDAVDNDGDGLVDEVNTVAENGAHPYYGTLLPTDTAAVAVNITSVVGAPAGAIVVTYADNSVYSYTVFTTTTAKNTKVEQYKSTGYAVAIDRKGKKIKLINLYDGTTASSKALGKKSATSASLLLDDVRDDNKTEAIVTTLHKQTATVYLVKVKAGTGTLTITDTTAVTSNKVATNKTKIKKSTIILRTSKNKTVAELKVNKKYQFVD
ncbi:MAG: hypothetical protein HY565_05420, partial [Candidatus Kerfeldbacteria bacterium]|nr:hypothetical protein [Candidatus Kerfeldbacteria bacterium]